jgi:hypothetical protein
LIFWWLVVISSRCGCVHKTWFFVAQFASTMYLMILMSWLYFECGKWIHVKGVLGTTIVKCYIFNVFDHLDLLSLASKWIACSLKNGGNIFFMAPLYFMHIIKAIEILLIGMMQGSPPLLSPIKRIFYYVMKGPICTMRLVCNSPKKRGKLWQKCPVETWMKFHFVGNKALF